LPILGAAFDCRTLDFLVLQAAFANINIAAVIAGESSGLVRDITSAA
jgi:hypothetical protein